LKETYEINKIPEEIKDKNIIEAYNEVNTFNFTKEEIEVIEYWDFKLFDYSD
jgi:hypothetical protein